ncbi:MAG: methyltransferase domain-containing protein [Armatimonadetes bacterium]|nr:methyltransferase domain-containing protein [Armatimonadota bacterium]MBS1710836.1 methyltransferase domain-containing protein [Armatimonadota bacterium]MBX3108508.1 methyltransferase domain-containing protein [Fimbriimonadaceae bacterium]
MASFGPIAPHYDLLMANVPYDMWAGYYRLLLTRHELDPDTLLDVCCGTGTLAELLTEAGYRVTGFDLSAPMVEEARKKALRQGLDIRYHVADATDFNLGESFQGAYSFFDSLNYITCLEGLQAATRCVAAHLEPGGSFVFDVNTPYAFEQHMFDQEDQRKRALIKYSWKGDYDPASRIIRVDMEFERSGETFHETHVQRAHSDEEIREALHASGFASCTAYDSYSLDRPRVRSDRVHYVALMPF